MKITVIAFFPAFNLADTWITVGVVMVGWRLIFEDGREAREGAGPPAPRAGTDEVGA